MRLFKKWSVWALAVAILVTAVPCNVLEANAAPATYYERSDFETKYNELMSSSIAPYLILAQPKSALVPYVNTQVNTDSLSPNYTAGVIDLPRLQAGYYYSVDEVAGTIVNGLDDVYGLRVNRTLYPSLSWSTTLPMNTAIVLSVKDEATNAALLSFTLTTVVELAPIDSNFVDVSKTLISTLTSGNASKYNGSVTYYPAELHKDSIITSKFAAGFSDNFEGFRVNLMNNVSIGESLNYDNAHKFTNYISKSSTVSVKEAVWPYISGSNNGRPEMFAVFEPVGLGVSYDSNRGTVSTSSAVTSSPGANVRGSYVICTDTTMDWYTVALDQYTGNLSNVSETAPLVTLAHGQTYDIENSLGKYGFKDFLATNNAVFDISNYPEIKYTGSTDNTINVYQSALAYGGVLPNVATMKCTKPVDTFKVVTWYTRPNETLLKKCEEITVNVGSSIPSLKAPSDYVSLYTFDTWYTDQACTKKVDLSQLASAAKANDVLNLYGKYNYTGGNYSVTFYNDFDNSSSTSEYEVRTQPTLPPNPTRPGYLFRNWQIVYTTSSSSGTVYDPATFNPQTSVKYLFKTFWDVQGVITSAQATKKEYYVGDYIDKDNFVVTVQTDNSGTVRTLNADEFSISPDKMEREGNQQFVVTYNATGATATVNLTGKKVTPLSISAKYTGGEVNVGDTLSSSSIVVTVHYNNNTTEEVRDFTITPTTITNAGGNVIRVLYGNLSTTVNVTGKKAASGGSGIGSGNGGSTKPGTGSGTGSGSGTGYGSGSGYGNGSGSNSGQTQQKVLQTIQANYRGAQPYEGESIKANDINVVATYTDGTNTTLSSTAFQYSPSFIRNSGTNTIVVTYGGKQASFTVDALPMSSNPNAVETVTGVDNDGNPVTSTTGESKPQSTVTQSKPLSSLGNPLTGAGIPSSEKGTSVGYLNGNNILTNRLYGSTTAIENDYDILSEIKNASSKASGLTVELYNGASGNDITAEMLGLLKEKDLMLTILMLNPDNAKPVAKWVILGELLNDTNKPFNPNVSFEVTDKGSDILTYMTVLETEYPDNTQLTVYPATSTYASGELIRLYSCGLDKSNAHLESSFTWLDDTNEVILDIAKSSRYCMSNALAAYPEGGSLTENIDLPSMGDSTIVEQNPEEETSEEFDWGDEDTTADEDWDWGEEPEEPAKEKGKFPWIVIPIALVVIILGAGSIVLFTKLRKSSSNEEDEEFVFGEGEDSFDPNELVEEVIDEPEDIDLE